MGLGLRTDQLFSSILQLLERGYQHLFQLSPEQVFLQLAHF
jgi:hypothetical protein